MKRLHYSILLLFLCIFSILFLGTYQDGFGEYKYRDTDVVAFSTAEHDKSNYIKKETIKMITLDIFLKDNSINDKIDFILGQALDEVVPGTWTTITSDQLNSIAYAVAREVVRECASEMTRQARISHDDGTPSYKALMEEAAWMKMRYGVK